MKIKFAFLILIGMILSQNIYSETAENISPIIHDETSALINENDSVSQESDENASLNADVNVSEKKSIENDVVPYNAGDYRKMPDLHMSLDFAWHHNDFDDDGPYSYTRVTLNFGPTGNLYFSDYASIKGGLLLHLSISQLLYDALFNSEDDDNNSGSSTSDDEKEDVNLGMGLSAFLGPSVRIPVTENASFELCAFLNEFFGANYFSEQPFNALGVGGEILFRYEDCDPSVPTMAIGLTYIHNFYEHYFTSCDSFTWKDAGFFVRPVLAFTVRP